MKNLLLFIFLFLSAVSNAQVADIDGDGIANNVDNCPFYLNLDQSDRDEDAIGDICDCYPDFSAPVGDRPTGIYIAASADTVVPGTPVVFTSSFILCADTAPVYQWYKNNLPVGANSSSYTDSTLQTGDSISCSLTSHATGCDSGNARLSNQLIITIVSVPSSINNLEDNNDNLFNIFPNPATNLLFIETNGTAVSEVNIYNTTGSFVSSVRAIHESPQLKSIDISQLANGVYIAEIKTKEASVMRRWVKM